MYGEFKPTTWTFNPHHFDKIRVSPDLSRWHSFTVINDHNRELRDRHSFVWFKRTRMFAVGPSGIREKRTTKVERHSGIILRIRETQRNGVYFNGRASLTARTGLNEWRERSRETAYCITIVSHRHGWSSPGNLQQSSQLLVGGSSGPAMHWQDSKP